MKTKLVVLFVLLAGITNLSAQLNDNVLKVEGEAIVYETPENMNIDIPLSVKEDNYAKCAKQLTERYNKLVAEFGKIAIDKSLLQTSNYSIQENYIYENNTRKFDGYNGNITINLEKKYDVDVLNNIINVLTVSDSKPSYSVTFNLSPQQKEKMKKATIEKAIADGKNKASIIAESLGLKLSAIKEINFNYPSASASPFQAETRMTLLKVNESASGLQLTPQMTEIRETIDIIWQIEQPK